MSIDDTIGSGSEDTLGEYLDSVREVPGVRPINRVPRETIQRGEQSVYMRRAKPGTPIGQPRPQLVMTLVRQHGVLRWIQGTPTASPIARRAGYRSALPAGKVVKQYAFESLDGSKVTDALIELDRVLTPNASYADAGPPRSGLRQWRDGSFQPFPDASDAQNKNVLLFIHGTFSNSEALLTSGLGSTTMGKKLLNDACRHYDLVLTYDHPTLSVSPALNAFDLAAHLRPAPKRIDIVCHSRGGLVARWFCEAFSAQQTELAVVFVGSPLAGTSLAAAPKIRATLDLLTNIADFARLSSDALAWVAGPVFTGISGLLRVVTAVTGTLASAPLVDAAVALIPGLNAQAHVGNNEEIRRLRANTGGSNFSSGRVRYHCIQSDFEPTDPKWNFLQYFSKPLQRVSDFAADLVFDDANDLVVDTKCMSQVADAQAITIAHDFGTNASVHHLNYFIQDKTVESLRKTFAIPN